MERRKTKRWGYIGVVIYIRGKVDCGQAPFPSRTEPFLLGLEISEIQLVSVSSNYNIRPLELSANH